MTQIDVKHTNDLLPLVLDKNDFPAKVRILRSAIEIEVNGDRVIFYSDRLSKYKINSGDYISIEHEVTFKEE